MKSVQEVLEGIEAFKNDMEKLGVYVEVSVALTPTDVPRCPDCRSPLEMRRFMDGGKDGDINSDFWCAKCHLRWLSMEGPPMEGV